MNTRSETIKESPLTAGARSAIFGEQLARTKSLPASARAVLDLLNRIKHGQVVVRLPDGSQHVCGESHSGHSVDLVIHEWRVFDEILSRGDIGAAEAFIEGLWGTESLTSLLTLISKNRDELRKAIHGNRWQLIGAWILHKLRANTRQGSKRNIMAHYDLGNDFYRLWLDETMTYSRALFNNQSDPDLAQWSDLPEAQRAKNERMIQSLALNEGDHVLEIGCGWAGFAEQATAQGAKVTGLTLSPAQQEFAKNRAQSGRWDNRAEFHLTDYRDMTGQFDHIVSVEMFEAVGERWWPTYFRTLKRLLKPGGKAVIQVITIDDRIYPQYRKGTDFIQRHVFPGGMLPSPRAFKDQAARADMAVVDDMAFGAHYAKTLELWHDMFMDRILDVKAQGFDDRFIRLWRFYLSYCEAGFRAGSIDVHQYTLAHAGTA